MTQRTLLSQLVSYSWNNLGSCSYCLRTAFRTAMAGWCLTLLIAALGWSAVLPSGVSSVAVSVAIIGAVTLTALWMAHLVVYVRKATVAKIRREIVQPPATVSRRTMLTLFARTLGATALMSAVPAFGQDSCPGGTSACGQFCNDVERGQVECEFSRPCYDRQGRCFCVNRGGECD